MRKTRSGEISSNAGGLFRWPARLLVPTGFLLLSLQGISELIKRVVAAGPEDDAYINVNNRLKRVKPEAGIS